MVIDVKTPPSGKGEYVIAYENGQWKAVGKSAYLEPYMKRNERTEAKFEGLRSDFETLQAQFEELRKGYEELAEKVADAKKAMNSKLKEYHDVLKVLANDE